jgi:NAD-dependent SIR2 family protein deacetylase
MNKIIGVTQLSLSLAKADPSIAWARFIYLLFIISSVNIKPTRHHFVFSLAWDWQFFSLYTQNFDLGE